MAVKNRLLELLNEKGIKQTWLAEFQGRQHYEHIKGMQTKKEFENQVINDKRKVNYCNENKIPLLIIPYTEFDRIEEILDKELNKLILKNAN